jgi:hypothetical protein
MGPRLRRGDVGGHSVVLSSRFLYGTARDAHLNTDSAMLKKTPAHLAVGGR